MTQQLRLHLARTAALLGALAMVLAPLLLSLHRAQVQHARCAEHGELVELTHAADTAGDAHQDHHDPVASSGAADHHDAHCAVDQGLGTAVMARHVAAVAATQAIPARPLLASASPRGPPLLHYAPKTSPPSCA